jgi:hypothetical protein
MHLGDASAGSDLKRLGRKYAPGEDRPVGVSSCGDPSVCPCCGGGRLRKIGEDVTDAAGTRSASVESHPARTREVLLPSL